MATILTGLYVPCKVGAFEAVFSEYEETVEHWTHLDGDTLIEVTSTFFPLGIKDIWKRPWSNAWIWWLSVMWRHVASSVLTSPMILTKYRFRQKLLYYPLLVPFEANIRKINQYGSREHCGTSRKVAGSISKGGIGIYRWINHFGRTMALGSTQFLREISIRNISCGVKTAGA